VGTVKRKPLLPGRLEKKNAGARGEGKRLDGKRAVVDCAGPTRVFTAPRLGGKKTET